MTTLTAGRQVSRPGTRARLMRRTALGGVLLVMANASVASAAPVLAGIPAQVTHAPVITTPTSGLTTVTLNQSRTLINWQSFNITQGEQVDFLFQNTTGIVLNRVNSLASIDGKILGCVLTCGAGGNIGGNVWIYSPTGVIFGPHAEVNVGGLLATTSPLLSDKAFLDGSQTSFQFGGGSAVSEVVVHAGARLKARGALALISPSVTTEAGSTIEAGGTALYGAAQNYVIHFDESAGHGLSLLDFEVPASALSDGTISTTPLSLAGATTAGKVIIAAVNRPTLMNAVISLGGTISATSASDGGGGDIVLSATGAPTTVNITGALQASHGVSIQAPDGGAINLSGTVSTVSAAGAGGAIQIGGAGTAAVDLAAGGRLDASSTGPGLAGGSVTLTGSALQVDGTVAATGPAGGGTILVGGGAQGRDASVTNATTTTIGADALLDASATGAGDGGRVVVWSNQSTLYQGAIQAQGTAGGGAEVSSGGYLSYAGTVDLRGANGAAGQLLLDPSELIIVPSGAPGTIASGTNPAGTTATSTISADTIDAALQSADVTISTHMMQSGGDGVIEFNGGSSPLTFNYGGTGVRTLSFLPEKGFLFDTSVETMGPLNLTLNAGTNAFTLPATASISVSGGALTLAGSNVNLMGDLAANQVTLTASGAISQAGGVITTSVLTGSSGGQTSLTGANAVATLQNFTAGADLSFTNNGAVSATNVSASGGPLTLTTQNGALSATGVSASTSVVLNAAGDLLLGGAVTAPAVQLTSGGSIGQSAGVITTGTLSGFSTGSTSLAGANAVGTLANFSAGSDLTFVNATAFSANAVSGGDSVGLTATTGALTAAGVVSGGTVSLIAAGDLDLTGNITGPTTTTLTTDGTINQTAGVITTNILSGSSVGSTSLTGAIASLQNFSDSGNLTVADSASLLANTVSAGGALSLTTAGSLTADGVSGGSGASLHATGNLFLTGDVDAPTLALTAGGAIAQGGGVITAGTLTATSATGLKLADNNQVAAVTTLSNSGGGGLSFNDNQAVTIGSVSVGGGDISLSTGAGNLTVTSAVNAPGGLSEMSNGALSGTSATAATGPLSLQGTSVTFTGAVTSGGDLTVMAGGAVSFGSASAAGDYSITSSTINTAALQPTLTGPASNLTIDFIGGNPVNLTGIALNAPGRIDLETPGSLTIGSIAAGDGVTLSSGGAINEAAGASITTAGQLQASAVTGMTFNGPNAVFELGDLTNTTSGGISFTNAANLTLNGALSAPGQTVSLNVTGAISQPGAFIVASVLTGSATGAAIFSDANTVGAVQNFTAGGNLTFTDTIAFSALNLSSGGVLQLGTVQGGITAGNLTGATSTSLFASGDLTLSGNISGPVVTLTALAALTQSGGVVTANNLTASAVTGINLTDANAIGGLGAISNSGLGGIAFTNTGDINLQGSLFAPGQTVTLVSTAGGINQTGGIITAGTLTGSSVNAAFLNDANAVGALQDFYAGQNLSFTNSISLAAADVGEGGPIGALSLTTTTGSLTVNGVSGESGLNLSAAGDLILAGDASARAVALTAGGAIDQVGGGISANTLTASAVNGISLTGPVPTDPNFVDFVGALTNTSSGGIAFTNLGDIILTGAVIAPGQPVSLVSTTGAITESGGAITADTLSAFAADGIDLTAANAVANLGALVSASSGGVAFSDTSDINLTGDIGAVGQLVTLQSGGAINQTGGVITASQLTASAATALNLSGANQVDEVVSLSDSGTGGLSFNDHQSVSIDSVSLGGGDLTLTTTGGDLNVVGGLNAPGNLTLAASGAVSLIESATVVGDYSVTGFSINTAALQPSFNSGSTGSLIVDFTNPVGTTFLDSTPLSAPGSVSVTTANDLVLGTIIAEDNVTLTSAGAINQNGEEESGIVANSLTASAVNGLQLNQANSVNTVISLTNTGSGDLVFANAPGVTIGPVTNLAPGGLVSLSTDNGDLTLIGAISGQGEVSIEAGGNLTVDGITTPGDVTLFASAALTESAGAAITLGGNYTATASTINAAASQPIFMPGSTGNLSLTFNEGEGPGTGVIDLTGTPLSAPGAVSVAVPFEDLIVDSITAGSDVNLTTGGNLSASPGAVISLFGNYSATAFTINSANPTVLQPTFQPGSFGNLSLTFTEGEGSIDIPVALSAPGSVSINANSNDLTTQTITAGGEVDLSTNNNLFAGPINAGSDVNLSANDSLTSGSITSGGNVTLFAGESATVGPIHAANNVSLFAGELIAAPGATITLGGDYTVQAFFVDPTLFQPIFTPGSSGSINLTINGSEGVVDFTGHPLTAPGSVSISAPNESLNVDSITAGGDVTLFTGEELSAASGATITLFGNYSATANFISAENPTVLQPTFQPGSSGNLSLTFNAGEGFTDLIGTPLSAPGSVSVTANQGDLEVDNITAGQSVNLTALQGSLDISNVTAGQDVTLIARDTINTGEGGGAIRLFGNYSLTEGFPGDRTVLQPTFLPGSSGSLSLTFTEGEGVINLNGTPLSAPGSVSVALTGFSDLEVDNITAGQSVNLQADEGSLTIRNITAGQDVNLFAANTISAINGSTITLFGDYTAEASFIQGKPVLQPNFMPGSSGSINLTFDASTFGFGEGFNSENLTGIPLTAPGSISISAPNEDLTVDSLTAGGDINLFSGGTLSAASGATITLFGSYSATAGFIDSFNPTIMQPTFLPGSNGNLSLTFTQGEGFSEVNVPLSAPGSVSVTAQQGDLQVDDITAGLDVNVTAQQGSLEVFNITAGRDVNLFAANSLSEGEGAVRLFGNYSATGGTISSNLYQPTFLPGSSGSLSLTFTQSAFVGEGFNPGPNLSSFSLTAPGSISISAPNEDLTVGSLTAGGDVNLLSGGNLSAAPGAVITLFGNYSAQANTISTENPTVLQPTFLPGSFGSLSLTINGGEGATNLTGIPLSAPGSVSVTTNNGDLTLDTVTAGFDVDLSAENGNLTVSSITSGSEISLFAGGAITELNGSVISGARLDAFAFDGISLTGANNVGSLGQITNLEFGDISFTNTGDIVLTDNITANGQTVNLVSTGGQVIETPSFFTDEGFVAVAISAETLNVSAVTGINLNNGNTVNSLGAISNSTSGGISFVNNNDLFLTDNISAPGQTVSLVSSGQIVQSDGVITAGEFSAFANFGITLNGPNAVETLGALNNAFIGGISFTNDGGIALGDDITAFGQAVTLTSNNGAIVQVAGFITADTLNAEAVTGISLNNGNAVTNLGSISNSASGGFSFTNAGDLNLTGFITVPDQTVSLVTSGALTQPGGSIEAGELDISAVNGIAVGQANSVDSLGVLSTTAGGVSFTNATDFTLTGNIGAAGQAVSLTSTAGAISQTGGVITADSLTASGATGLSLTDANNVTNLGILASGVFGGIAYTSSGNIGLVFDINGFGQTVSLDAVNGAVTQASSETIVADLLNVAAKTGIDLTSANTVVTLGDVSTSASGGGIGFTDIAGSLTLAGDITAAGAPGFFPSTGQVGLSSAGSLNQAGGVITADTLFASATLGIALNGANQVNGLAAQNATSGGVSFNNVGNLTIDGAVGPGQTVSLTSQTGAIGEAVTATVVANTLNASAATGVTLNGANTIANLGLVGNSTSGGVSIVDAGGLTLTSDVVAIGQTVSLISTTGAITQSGGIIAAGSLTASAVTGLHFNDSNAVAQLGALSNSTSGNIFFLGARGGDLILTGDITAVGQAVGLFSNSGALDQSAGVITTGQLSVHAALGVELNDANAAASLGTVFTDIGTIGFTNASNIILAGPITAQKVNLTSNTGAVAQAAGVITTFSLNVSAVNGIVLNDANVVSALGVVTNSGSGGISFTNAGDFKLTGNLNAAGQTVSLASTSGSINQNGGVITAGTLNASAVNGIVLLDNNAVTSLGVLSNSGALGIGFADAGSFNLTGNVTATGLEVLLTSTSGAITQTGGAITAGTLNASAVTGLSLTDANAVTNVGTLANATSGGVAFTNVGNIGLTTDLIANGQSISLISTTGAVTQSGGERIVGGTLNASGATGVILNDANAVNGLGALSAGAGGVGFTNFNDLTLTGVVTAAGQNVSLTSLTGAIGQTGGGVTAGGVSASAITGLALTGANTVTNLGALSNAVSGGIAFTNTGNVNLTSNIAAAGQSVSLASTGGALTQSGGQIITAATLNASGATGVALNDANAVVNLGTVANSGSGGVSFTDAGALILTGNVTAVGQAVSLVSANGALSQSGGVITVGLLNASAVDGVSLGQANAAAGLGVVSNSGTGGVNFTNAGDFTVGGNITATDQELNLVSEGGAINQIGGNLSANDVTLTAGNISQSGGTAEAHTPAGEGPGVPTAGSISMTSGSINAGTVTLTANGAISQTGGSITAQAANVDATGAVTLSALTASKQANIIAGAALTLTAGEGAAVQAPVVNIESRTGSIDIGDGLVDPGFTGVTISNASFQAIRSDAISVYAGFFSGARLTDLAPQTAIAIKVGDLSINSGGLTNSEAGATVSLFAGPTSTIEVSGAVTPSQVGRGTLMIGDNLADAWTPQTIGISGSIGATGSKVAEFDTIELNATDTVVMGTSGFQNAITRAVGAGQAGSVNITTGSPGGVQPTNTGNLFIGANNLILRGQGVIASQNTGGVSGGSGIDLTNDNKATAVLFLGTTAPSTGKTTPVVIDIFGTLTDPTGLVLTGSDAAPSPLIVLNSPLAITDNYRINGCTIGKMNVCALRISSDTIKLIEGVQVANQVLPPIYYSGTILITEKTDNPIGDPTLTGMGNEEIWRDPVCDPSGGTKCP